MKKKFNITHIHLIGVAGIALLAVFAAGCIHNDLPYPRLVQKIVAIAAEGEKQRALIDSLSFEATVYLEETADIENVRFSEFAVTEGAESDPNLLEGAYDLSSPIVVRLSKYQTYDWTVKAEQEIARYFTVEGQIGESVIDPVAHRVIVTFPEGTDLSDLTLQSVKLGPVGITTITPALEPGKLDLFYPLRVEVECFGRSEYWTIYAELTELVVNTTNVDAWSEVVWAYGEGPSDSKGGFQYREASSSEWLDVPAANVTQTEGAFSAYIPHLKPLTEYVVRAVAGTDIGNEVKVKTEGTADIPDGDFEQWFENANGMWCPWNENGSKFWDTGNGGSITLKQNLTTPTDYTPTGSGKAARCETRYVALFGIGKLGTGSIFSGDYVRTDGTNGILAFGRQWNLRPTKLKGYYQYSGKTIDYASTEYADLKGRPDSCHIYVALTDWTTPFEIRTNPRNRVLFDKNASYVIAYGELIFSGQMDAYKEFEIKLEYRDTHRVPTYLQITSAASKYGDYFSGGAGSLLYVDQFSFGWDLE